MYVLIRYLVATVFYISIDGVMSRNGGGNDDMNIGRNVGISVAVVIVVVIAIIIIIVGCKKCK